MTDRVMETPHNADERIVMMDQVALQDVKPGDVVEVVGHTVTDTPRSGRVLEVRRTAPRSSLRVQWRTVTSRSCTRAPTS